MGSTIFFIVGGFCGCTRSEDCDLIVFSVVLSWLGGFFCGGFFYGGFAVFSHMLWWLGSFSVVLSWLGGFFCVAAVFFLLLMVLALLLLMVYFGTPNMFITLWFGFVYGTNPPLGTLII
jgi:hypothetical protein